MESTPSPPASSVAVRIQHHPSRTEVCQRLVNSLPLEATVVPDPGANDSPNAWRAHRACLEAMGPSASHLLVLQDDALILDPFSETLERVLAEKPESLVTLFTPGFRWLTRSLLEAKRAGHHYARLSVGAFVPTVAILYPRAIVDGLLAWSERREPPHSHRPMGLADDGVLAIYCRARRLQPLATVPPVVDHDDTVATIGKRVRSGPHRRAAVL